MTERSNALDLERGVFTWRDPRRIARSLKRSALQSTRRRGTPYQSAMSMLTFYINRAGRQLTPARRAVLNEAKGELRSLFERGPITATARRPPQSSRRQRQLIAAAFHEAGHAVAAYHLHVRLRRVSIGSHDGHALGWLELWPPELTAGNADDIRMAHAVERNIIVLLAGAQAERIGIARVNYTGSGLDFYEAMRRAGTICRTSEEMSAYLRWLQLRVHALVARPTWRLPVEALATRLLERRELSARETRAVIVGTIAGIQGHSPIRRSRSAAPGSRRHHPRAAGVHRRGAARPDLR